MPSRIELKNHLRNRTCQTCMRKNAEATARSRGIFGQKRREEKWCDLKQTAPELNTCSQWKMGPVDRAKKYDKHREQVKAKRKAKREARKLALAQP